MSNKLVSLALGGALGLLAVPSCDLEIPDLNNPGLEQLQNNPTVAGVNAAATGMLVGNRAGKSATTGLVNQLGILGRESYDFDPNDARFITEEVQGALNRGSPFGGVLWAGNFANIRNGYIVIHALDKLAGFDDPAAADTQKSAMRGFVHTIQGTEFLNLYLTHYDTGAPIDVDHPLDAPLAPFVSKDDVLKEANRLLDLGLMELMAGGDAFTFPLSPGYAGFNTPKKFVSFNRAMRAQAALYAKDYAGALTALAAIDPATKLLNEAATTTADFNVGVFYSYSTNSGDATNALANRKSVFAHPSFKADVKMQDAAPVGDPTKPDARYVAKIVALAKPVTSTNDTSLTTDIGFNLYTSASTPIPVIRNEELILIKAEALWFSNMHDAAITELNIVRTKSGKLPALDPATITDNTAFINALLYDRRYSLMYEGGHRWIDLRRFNIPLPLDKTSDPPHVRNLRFPVPQQECDARPGEAACNIKSTDPIAN
jgi:starch-binding outer membrane protein, SusD/RagB family